MPDLQNTLAHAANTTVTVNGTKYEIDGSGVARDVDPDDAKRLLKGTAWRVPRTPVAGKSGKSGKPAKKDPEPVKAEKPPAVLVPDPVPETEEPEAPEEPEPESEWPDPTESMTPVYLREMADAYEVKYTSRTTKKSLVKLIKKAMYE